MGRNYGEIIPYVCSSDCEQSGCPGHKMQAVWCRSSDTVAIHVDGKPEYYFNDNSIDALVKAVGTPLGHFWSAHAEWSQATFGADSERGPIGPLKHLAKEAVEAQEKPDDLEEYADCLFLTFDATRRAGFTLEQLTEACFKKLEKNKKRKWGPATKDGAVEHDRSGE